MALVAEKLRRVILVGKPNVGKSVLYHALTGRYATVSNYSGTTMDLRRACVKHGTMEVLDTPGLFSLVARSEDEKVTRDELLRRDADLIVHVGNASDLPGTLTMTLDLARLGAPMILALNLFDEACAKGIEIDIDELSGLLGIPVVATVATRGRGIAELKELIEDSRRTAGVPEQASEVRRAVEETAALLSPERARWALLAFTGDDDIRRVLAAYGRIPQESLAAIGKLRRRFSRRPDFLYMRAARERAQELAARTFRKIRGSEHAGRRILDSLGRWTLRPVSGGLIALLMLWLLYQFVGVFGAQTAVGFIEGRLFAGLVNPVLTTGVERILPWGWARDLLVGPYGIFTMALTYAFALVLPIVTTFFLAFSTLEDSGYLPRFSVVTDRLFRVIGLNGKAVLPMLLGLGCGTMAIVTTRILETRRERLLVSFLLALTIPCSAQLGVILGMASGAGPAVLYTWLGVVGGSLVLSGWAASRFLPGAVAPFVIDIPPMRIPRLVNVLRKVGSRLKWYMIEVVPLFIYATLLLYVLDRTGGLRLLERLCAPLIQSFLGLPGEATGAFITGFLRRDYGAAGLFSLYRDGLLNPRQVAVSLVCITLFMPCIAQWLVILRERGWRYTGVITSVIICYSLSVAGLLNVVWRFVFGA
ncbi:MAG: ferrous iron transport protein B [Elusimicrobiota bacterium]